jgi:class 3 adenylate cyclase
MGADEEGTHERLSAHLRELVNPKIAEHRGQVVKNTGDGFLAEFPSVVDAVRCAVEVQRGMAEREQDVPDQQRVRLRIGINLGDVIAEEHEIFGDGVNVAARLEALAEPGGIGSDLTLPASLASGAGGQGRLFQLEEIRPEEAGPGALSRVGRRDFS